ncbi:MAG: hypothetical protein AAFQ94_25845 [Bacteroidota bacterium]
MSNKYSLFRKISDQNLFTKIKDFLILHEFDYLTDHSASQTAVLVASHEMQRLENLMLQHNDVFLESEPDDFYLQGFSEKELLDIVLNPSNWSAIDYHLAVNILGKRGVHIDSEMLSSLRNLTLVQGEAVYAY